MSNQKQLPHSSVEGWKGYTLDELRYARAYTAARMELNRGRLMSRLEEVSKSGLKTSSPAGILGKVLGAFSYIDIALMTWKIGRRMFRLTRSIRH